MHQNRYRTGCFGAVRRSLIEQGFAFHAIWHSLTICLALPGHNFELMKPDYLKPQSSIWQLSKNLQQMRNGRIPNLGSHQTVMGGEYPKAGDKRPHKLTDCEKKKVCPQVFVT